MHFNIYWGLGLSAMVAGTVFVSNYLINKDNLSENNPNEITANTSIPSIDEATTFRPKAIDPPFKGMDIPYEKRSIDATSEAQRIEFETGTVIEIPKGAFVDKDGNPVSGTVDIEFREFHNAPEIIASGISMNDLETKEYLETAGMFDIKGSQDGEEIFVKEGKELIVNIASFNDGPDFKNLKLDEDKCKWNILQDAEERVMPNKDIAQQKEELLEAIAAKEKQYVKPVKPTRTGSNDAYLFELDMNYNKDPDLKIFQNVVWEFVHDDMGQTDPKKTSVLTNGKYDHLLIKKSPKNPELYDLIMEKKGNVYATLTVRPTVSGADYEKAMAKFEKDLEAYNAVQDEIKDEIKRVKLLEGAGGLFDGMSAPTRRFRVADWGTYNVDRFFNPPLVPIVEKGDIYCRVNIIRADDLENKVPVKDCYLITNNYKSVIRYPAYALSGNDFYFNEKKKNILLVTYADNQIAVFSKEDFKKLDTRLIRKENVARFHVKTWHKKVDTVEDIAAAIGMSDMPS